MSPWRRRLSFVPACIGLVAVLVLTGVALGQSSVQPGSAIGAAATNASLSLDFDPPSQPVEEIQADFVCAPVAVDEVGAIDDVGGPPNALALLEARTADDADVVVLPPPTPAMKREDIAIHRAATTPFSESTARPWYRDGLVSLFVVLASIVGLAWAAKRYLTPSQGASEDILRVLCKTHLSPKQSIALVQIGGRFAFVGVTPDRITNLRIVEDAEEAAALRVQLRLDRIDKEGGAFREALTHHSTDIANHLEPSLPPTPDRRAQLAHTRDDLRGLLRKLQTYTRESKADVET